MAPREIPSLPFPQTPPGLEPLTVSSRLSAGIPEVEREIDQPLRVPIHLAEIEALIDEPYLIPNVRSNEGGLGIVEDDAFLAVEPASRLVDARDDGFEAERQDLVAEKSGLGVEDLALPGEDINSRRDIVAERGSRRYDRGACAFAVRNGASLMRAEKRIELGLRHAEQLLRIQSHSFPPQSYGNDLRSVLRRVHSVGAPQLAAREREPRECLREGSLDQFRIGFARACSCRCPILAPMRLTEDTQSVPLPAAPLSGWAEADLGGKVWLIRK